MQTVLCEGHIPLDETTEEGPTSTCCSRLGPAPRKGTLIMAMCGQVLRMLSLIVVLLSLLAAAPASTIAKPSGANGGPGNSGAAKMCKDGKWAHLAGEGSASIAFTSQDECVSHGAQGGLIVAYVPVVEAPTVALSWVYHSTSSCVGRITVTNFADGPHTATVTHISSGTAVWAPSITVNGGTGSVMSYSFDSWTGLLLFEDIILVATVNGVSSEPSTVAC